MKNRQEYKTIVSECPMTSDKSNLMFINLLLNQLWIYDAYCLVAR